MEASPNQIIQFFNGFKQSIIPLFQRPYEWEEKHWETLWDDALERYEVQKDLSHFMGTIVTMPSRSVPVGVSKHLVIDGQQRLTTLAILLCAIRDELPESAKTEKSRIQNHYLINDGYESWDYLKILPTQDDRESFLSLVKGDDFKERSQIKSAYRFFVKKLKGNDSDGNVIDVRRFLDTVERKLIIVSINLGEADDPYLIFESLNAKGSPLTQADLARNYFLMRFPIGEQESVYKNLWLPMQRRLGDHLTEFMRHYLMRDGDEVIKSEVYADLKRRLQELKTTDSVKSILEEMGNLSEFYLKFVKPREEKDPELQDRFYRLLNWEVTTSYALLLKIYDAYASTKISKDEIARCLQNIESFVVRRAVCNVPTNQLKKAFLQAAKNFRSENVVVWLRTELSSGTSGRRWPKDDEFKDAWGPYQAYSVPKRCKLLLEALEESYGHKEIALLEDATIEHIMPQELTEAWRSMLGENYESVHNVYCNTIGNLTLTAYNSELSNFSFSKKQDIYLNSHYSLNSYFSKCTKWDEIEIKTRATALWEKAKEVWPSPPL